MQRRHGKIRESTNSHHISLCESGLNVVAGQEPALLVGPVRNGNYYVVLGNCLSHVPPHTRRGCCPLLFPPLLSQSMKGEVNRISTSKQRPVKRHSPTFADLSVLASVPSRRSYRSDICALQKETNRHIQMVRPSSIYLSQPFLTLGRPIRCPFAQALNIYICTLSSAERIIPRVVLFQSW